MDYTIEKNEVIFELSLSDYLGESTRYNRETKTHNKCWLNSIQDYEIAFFDNFESFGQYTDFEEFAGYYKDYQEAIDWLKDQGYSDDDIAAHHDVFKRDIICALSDARDNSYQSEWLTKFFHETQKKINADLVDAFTGFKGNADYSYQLLDRIDDETFKSEKTDQDYLRLSLPLSEVLRWIKDNNYQETLEEWTRDGKEADAAAEVFIEYALNNLNAKPIDTEYIDHYGTMGDCDDWLEYFKDQEETAAAIDATRKDEAAKLNNLERAALELKAPLATITGYIDKYITQEPARAKITRQVKALKSVIKNQE